MRTFLKIALSWIVAIGLTPAAAFAAPATSDVQADPSQTSVDQALTVPAETAEAPGADSIDNALADSKTATADDPTDTPDAIALNTSDAVNAPEVVSAPAVVEPAADENADPMITASVSADEKIVKLTASGGDFDNAGAVSFKVWPHSSGESSAIEYGAKRQEDGAWLATEFIAPATPLAPGLPYYAQVPNAVYRLFNTRTGLHLNTIDANEVDVLTRQEWNYEGAAWITPSATSETAVPVYRAFNSVSGEHHYTADLNEYQTITKEDWAPEGVAFVSDPNAGVKVYRLFNPREGGHLYTIDENEYNVLGQNGWNQEGIAFYGDEINADGSWSISSRGKSHCVAGNYVVEAYVTPATEADDPAASAPDQDERTAGDEEAAADGDDESNDTSETEPIRVAETAFSISAPSAVVSLGEINNPAGTFDIIVSDVVSTSGIGKIEMPTWNRFGDRSDLRWYQAAPSTDGSYHATVEARNHGLALNYHTDVYVTGENGVMAGVPGPDCDMTLANYAEVTGGPYDYYVRLYNAGYVSSVAAYVWSEQDGQDDLRLYNAYGDGNGWWIAKISTSNLRHPGRVFAHIYADNTLRNGVTFTVQPWEIIAQKYITMNQKVNELASPSRYLLAVDTWNCFVGVYEGSRGNWRNIAYWPCTPGASWSPTVKGLFSVQSRGYVFGHGYSCYYWTQFYGDYLFHSILYNPGSFSVQDGTMGYPASHGCVRLWIENAKWIYDNVPSGTTVLTY